MRFIGQFLAWILLGVNAVVGLLLLISAYSPFIQPQSLPVLSCAGLAFPLFLIVNVLFLIFWLVVYRRYAILPVLLFICSWQAIGDYMPINLSRGDAPDGSIKILSFNTRAFGEKASHTKETPNEILAYLQESNADIICLQEYIWGKKLKKKDIDYAMRKYPYRHYYSLAGGLNGLGCYSRFPILSANPIKYKSKRNGSIAYQIKVEEDTLLVINNHLESFKIGDSDVKAYQEIIDSPNDKKNAVGIRKLVKKLAEGTAIRAQQVDTIASIASRFKGKGVIVCGDFNDSPVSYAHRVFNETLQDAFVQSGNGFGFSYVQHQMYFRIDHILISEGMQSYECTVDDSMKGSDHYPIWSYVSWK